MEIIFVRHGVSQANIDGVMGSDSSLADEGREQAEELAIKLKDEAVDAIFCSPMKRCRETAEPTAKLLKLTPIIDPRLQETGWGSFDSQPAEDLKATLGVEPKDYLDTYQYDLTKFGGENYLDVEQRIHSFLDDLKLQPYKKVLVVTHGGPVRMLNFLLTGQKINYQPNAVVIRHKLSDIHLLK